MSEELELLEAAKSISKQIHERSDEIEKARRVPADISDQMAKAGLYRMGLPRSLGGFESPPELSSRVFEILAQGDASCAWTVFIATTSCTALVAIPQTAAAEVFSDPETLITGVFAPTGTAEIVDGGFRVSGRWQWGSGSENATWVMGGCQLLDNAEPVLSKSGQPRTHMMIMPQSEVEFLDTWHVSGLAGTGSLDYQVKDLFVPEDRAVGFASEDWEAPGPLYTFPPFTFLALGIGAVCMGIARAAIDDLVNLAVEKKRAYTPKTVSEQPVAQVKLAQAEADLRSARLFYYDSLESAWACAVDNQAVNIDQRRDLRLATTNAVMTCARVVDAMYDLGGGSSVYENSNLQRYFRDIHVATSHIMVAPSTLETIGRLYFGLESNTATL
jgi:alkylation response protein AidB-like acyl-CoA dehydrogenase|tara:strand:+ start:2037 stop:3197 length:1161 start_codon:yes stop_codon:yes gene_type:complete